MRKREIQFYQLAVKNEAGRRKKEENIRNRVRDFMFASINTEEKQKEGQQELISFMARWL